MSHLTDDPCYLQTKNNSNVTSYKYMTTSFDDLIKNKEIGNYSIRHELTSPSDFIDIHSELLESKITNCLAYRGTDNQLPVSTIPAKYQLFHGTPEMEDQLRAKDLKQKKSCANVLFNKTARTFAIFDDVNGIETPEPVKAVEPVRFAFSTRF